MTAQLVERLARLVDRGVYSGGTNGPENAALLVLSEPTIADAMHALTVVNQLRTQHQWRRWSDESDAQTCTCGAGACQIAELLT